MPGRGVGQGQGGLKSAREVWTGPGRNGEGQGMVERGGEGHGGVDHASEEWCGGVKSARKKWRGPERVGKGQGGLGWRCQK